MTKPDTTAFSATWPKIVSEYLLDNYGDPVRIERLGGMSGAEVYKLHSSSHSTILKVTSRSTEPRFYEQVAPALHAAGINVPQTELNLHANGLYWLVMEYIPTPLPKERWLGDEAVMAMLARLHTLCLDPPVDFAPQWTEEMTASAIATLGGQLSSALKRHLYACCRKYQQLFARESLISGDPNPANWGLRKSGQLVLFDWERLAYGTPVIDLGITVPGLGTIQQYSLVASVYRSERTNLGFPYSECNDQLVQNIAASKLWSVVEFLASHHDGLINQPDTVNWLTEHFASWFSTLPL